MKYKSFAITAFFSYFFLVLQVQALAPDPEAFKAEGRVSIGNYENDFAGKVYFLMPLLNLEKFKRDSGYIQIEKGRVSDPWYGLYREYLGCGFRSFATRDWGYGGYFYWDSIGQEKELRVKNSYCRSILGLASARCEKTACLIPIGGLFNIGIEGFSSYLNANLNLYWCDSKMGRSTLYFPKQAKDGLLDIQENSYCLANKWAVDSSLWRRFSSIVWRVGGFYQTFNLRPNDNAKQEKEKPYNNWGGRVEVEYFLYTELKGVIKGSWDNWNSYRVSIALTFESSPKSLPIYQPTPRYLMPIQYDCTTEAIKLIEEYAQLLSSQQKTPSCWLGLDKTHNWSWKELPNTS